ncbi:TPA: hypothetical protein DDW69_03370 [candidate division CPR2 bacterium]|uniref:DDH domain-containing protein n=1 Tax=candidate division CPR2 bacterium GW2011_GWC1_41_48 TaxID=1618344 RepID=A0A0G0W7W2_UNCC2|nr:MAG: hypothetical protein UT47_C0003G0131 [candidate division CPR2 bacterium GW2011_GWC2_39_35]KKR28353.1 MAG: hypothetical protein UT60_C0022G0009 [candidate division CPR2 bacterium GW2011_GWD2_39_7]KKR28382.1 MAG: hypothetical protein UT59_C0029G0006 [candidate division CPR2 bacterium GW2011_GWD1_39_7]KKS09070.1 MAG: hypothetical protein UU65_C0003G0125 [candidate division CPR2 bacterium GW2011_GWC1_41_48]OGB60590.1 MAG: hypothetical protein A2Y27_02800 [candidate division CPR2 bacterium G
MNNFNLQTVLNEKKRIAIGFHPDVDGVVSMAMVVKSLEKKDFLLLAVNSPKRDFTKSQSTEINKFKPDLVINIDYHPNNKEQFVKLSKIYEILTIDHHLLSKERKNWPGEVMINPELLEKDSSKFSCSKVVFDLLGIKDFRWLAAIGLIGDSVAGNWPAFMQGYSEREMEMFGELSDIISFVVLAYKHDDLAVKVLRIVIASKSVRELHDKIYSDKKVVRAYDVIWRDIKENLERISHALKGKKIAFVEVKSKNNLRVIEMLSAKTKEVLARDKILVCYQFVGDLVEFRVMTETDFNSVSLIEGFGGGHKKRAGGAVARREFKSTLKLIKKRVGKQGIRIE